MPKVQPITDSSYWRGMETWEERTERRMREDTDAKWQTGIALTCLALFLLVYVWPMIWRLAR